MKESTGVLIALLSSALGGGAAVATRFLVGNFDPRTRGGAFGFFLWVVALRYATPTRVANTITINPLIAMAFGAMLLGERVTLPLILGLIAVCAGVWMATTNSRPAAET